jgi:hypothetical protein
LLKQLQVLPNKTMLNQQECIGPNGCHRVVILTLN